MEYVVCQMMAYWIQPPDGIIKGMGYPCQRVPVAGVEIKKGPFEKSEVKRVDVGVINDVSSVIPSDKIVPEGRGIDEKGQEGNRRGKTIFDFCCSCHLREAFSLRC